MCLPTIDLESLFDEFGGGYIAGCNRISGGVD